MELESTVPPEMPDMLSKKRMESKGEPMATGAMVEAVARHGYAGTTLRELVGLAGV